LYQLEKGSICFVHLLTFEFVVQPTNKLNPKLVPWEIAWFHNPL